MITSIKNRLLWILWGLTGFMWLASGIITYYSVGQALQEQIDAQLEQYSHLVTYISRVFARQIDEGLPIYESWGENGLEQLRLRPMIVEALPDGTLAPSVNIWLSGKLIAAMEGGPRFGQPVSEGFDYLLDGEDKARWRVLTRYDEVSELWIRVGVEFEPTRWALLSSLARGSLLLLAVLPLTLLLLYAGVSRGLQPLNNLAWQISQRKPAVLDPVDIDAVPVELTGVVDSINKLLQRLASALEGEQRFTANAAHELLTPLAAIKTEVQLCQRQLDDQAGVAMLQRIAKRVDRASHSVEQLLILARVDPEAPIAFERVPLRPILVEVLAETAHLAADRGLEIELAEGGSCVIDGKAESLAILLRNLLVNAFRYASDNSAVRIDLHSGDTVDLKICNHCAPLSKEEFARLCDRFYRVPGSTGMGAGLGLSIVKRIADQHNAEFTVQPGADNTQFCASVMFPPFAD